MAKSSLLLAVPALIGALFALAGCGVNTVYLPVPADDADFVRDVYLNEGLDFTLPTKQAAEAWKRAEVYLARYTGGLDYVYSFAIKSRYGTSFGSSVPWQVPGFNVTRLIGDDGNVHFLIQPRDNDTKNQSDLQAKYLARYMKTGEIRPHLIYMRLDLGQVINPDH